MQRTIGAQAAETLSYNAPMDIPATLLYSIISAIAEAALTPSPAPANTPEAAAMPRKLPEEAKQGVMLPPEGDGTLTIDGHALPLAPAAQIRNRQNLIVVPMQIQHPAEVVYLTDDSGAVRRVWMITPDEAALPRPR